MCKRCLAVPGCVWPCLVSVSAGLCLAVPGCAWLVAKQECVAYLEKRFEGLLSSVQECEKEDLEMMNHLSGKRGSFLRLSFRTVSQLMDVRKTLQPIIDRNAKQRKA